MTRGRKALIFAVVAALLGALALWALDAAFFGGGSPRDWLAPVLIGLGVGALAYFRPIQAAHRPKPNG
jgi:hypothetical protein